MIVSLLQLMGFPRRELVHSSPEETPVDKPSHRGKGSVVNVEHAQANPARRQEVKDKSGKANATKTVAPAVKPTSKLSVKTVSKSTVKPLAQPSKPIAKTAATQLPKSTIKGAVKPPAKVAAKPAPKTVPKVVQKQTAKPAAPLPSKPVSKPSVKAAAKAQPIPVLKPAVKSAAKPVSMPSVVSSSPAKPKGAPAPVAPVPVTAPAKAGRPSSRLAQVTVPSMAQAVASTAAKSSYSQSTPATLIAPMLPSAVKKDAKLVNNWKTTAADQLTDAELIAMPDSEYMNDVQMAAFKARLSKLKTEILASAGETTEHLREESSVTPDPADRATIEEEHALELRTRDRERKLLKKIEQSIGRIEAGDYGFCDETGEPIGVGRLLARPTATLSLEAQQRRELKQKMFGD